MGNFIDKVTGKDQQGNLVEAQIKHSYLNDSGNLEISNKELSSAAADSKVNIVSKSDIQIKPGDDGTLQLDCEQNILEGDPAELSVKVCNGSFSKSNRVVGAKINVADITIDNQKAHTLKVDQEDVFDIDKIRVTFRTDKWKTPGGVTDTPTRRNGVGPVEVKLRAKSFDVRCHGDQPGGGIALQTSGRDNDGRENKVKFESSRTSEINDPDPTYATEGGEGLEFGTFNNLHSSLFTADYRFNKDGVVYAATRETPVVAPGETKFDYPTQADDFKDVISDKRATTWENIVFAGMESVKVVSKSGKNGGYVGGYKNTMHVNIYMSGSVPCLYSGDVDTIYDASGNAVVFNATGWPSKAAVYTDSAHTTPVPASSKVFLQDGTDTTKYWIADINKSSELKSYGNPGHDEITMPVLDSVSGLTVVAPGAVYVAEDPVANAILDALDTATDFATFKTALQQSLLND